MPSWKKVIVSGSSAHLNQITGSGGVLLQDQVRLNFGDANDLKIYHSGTHSIIQDTGTGNLEIKASIVKLRGTAGGDSMGVFTEDGGVELYYDNSKKLDVVTGGVTVTGTLAATTLTGAHANADSAVQPADTFYIGTTSIAHNRGSGGLTLAGLTLTTPNLGTPSTLVGTNISGTASNLTVGATTGVEAGADVTDTTNVTAAGAVMDSEVTNLAFVKALTKGISDGNVLTANDVVADNDFLRISGTEVEGLTVAEVLSALSVESGATADQSNAEIVAAVEAGTDSNTFTDADHTHLNAIEASADVTDTTNVTAAGALMDSELSGISHVKALDQSVVSGATPTFTTTNFTDASNKRLMTDAQETLLDTVETSADVTDTTNVTAAGALMDSELSNLAAVKAINQGLTSTSDVNFNTININATTTSTTKTTGALIVDGGVGVAENIHAGGDVVAYASSDERLKDNIEVIENSLDKIGEIRGVTFDWNEESPEWAKERGRDVGVIAQEVRKVLPEIVVERTNGYLGVDYKRIIPLLIESIKELKQEVEDLKKKVN